MNTQRPILRHLLLALSTAAILLLALPAGLGAFVATNNTPASWFNFQPAPDKWLSTGEVQASVTVSDSDGLSQQAAYQISDDGISWSPWLTQNLQISGALTTTRHLTITTLPLPDGIHTVRYVITDALGFTETSPAASIQVDTQPPAAPESLQLTPSGWQTDTNPTWSATWQNPADLSGITAACYKVGAAPTTPQDGECLSAENIEEIPSIQPPAEGSHDLYLWLQDAAGNSSITHTAHLTHAIQWDATAPNLLLDIFGTLGQEDWYTSTVNVSMLASDNQSGIDQVRYQLDSGPWQIGRSAIIAAAGVHTLTAQAVDVAGNQKTTPPHEIKVDLAAPETTLTIDGAPNAQGWYEQPITLTFQTTDDASGVAATQWQQDDNAWQQQNPAVIATDGAHTLRYFSTDHAGHREAAITTTLKLDHQPPVTSYAVFSDEEPVHGWYRQPVTITLVPVDDGIGVESTYYRINQGQWYTGTSFTLTTSADYEISFYSIDLLGHQENIATIPDGVHIDTIPPRAPSPLAVTPGEWTQTNQFDLLFALPTDLSGIDGAYLKVGDPPLSPTDGQWFDDVTNTLSHIEAPDEGEYKAYVWLQDQAGNVDHGNYGVWEGALSLKYDATPPITHLDIAGDKGENGWYTTPITITFVPTDALSGPAATWVSIDGGEQAMSATLTLTQPGKHILRYHSLDQAGNQEADQFQTFRIDTQAPAAPTHVTVHPLEWTNTNAFTITWDNPQDTSGIGSAYYTIGHAPTHANDGTAIPATGIATGITAPREGVWDLYLWVKDKAGNVDISAVSHQPNVFHYDTTPPRSIFRVTKGEMGDNDWYKTPIEITITPTDLASGPAGVRYRINQSAWFTRTQAAHLTLDATGQYEIDYQSIDAAGNLEAPQHILIRVDIDPPLARFASIDHYQRISNFVINWRGVDQAQGSGIKGFQVQAKDGRNGVWSTWVGTASSERSRRYYGDYGHRYFFRIRAQDNAGNLSSWVEMPHGIYVDRLQNGDFSTGGFEPWQHGGALLQTVHSAPGPYGNNVAVVELGTEAYGASNNFDIPGNVPVGCAAITQTVHIPGSAVLNNAMLTFWYRMRTYDAEYSERFQKIYDTLDVHLIVGNEDHLALRTGQPYEEWVKHNGKKLADLGWRQAFIPIPRTMVDETVTISIENWNRNDNWLNTWTQITDVRIWEPYQLFLPQLTGNNNAAHTWQPTAPPTSSTPR